MLVVLTVFLDGADVKFGRRHGNGRKSLFDGS